MPTDLTPCALARHRDDLVRIACHLGLSYPAAEDVAQSCVLAVLQQVDAGREIEAPRAYLMSSLRHACARYAQRQKREAPLEEEPQGHHAEGEARVFLAEVKLAIDALPAEQAAVLLRVAAGEISPKAIAEDMELPVGTVMSRLARGRAALRAKLDLPREAPLF